MNLATLGIRVINEQAVAALGAVEKRLDATAVASDRTSVSTRALQATYNALSGVVGSTAQRLDATRQAQINLAAAAIRHARAMDEATASNRRYQSTISSGEMSNAGAWYDKMYGSAKKVTKVQAEVGSTAEDAVGGLGRLRQSFASLVAQATGTSPVIDRIVTTLGAFSAGNVVVIGVLAGIAAIGTAWHFMANNMSEDAQFATDAIKKLSGEVKNAKDAMGSLTISAATTNVALARQALAQAQARASNDTSLPAFARGTRDTTPGSFGAMISAADVGATSTAVTQAQAGLDRALADAATKKADALAKLVQFDKSDHEARQRAIKELQQDQTDMASLAGKFGDADVARRAELAGNINTLHDALFPKSRGSAAREKKPAFLDSITSGSVAIQQSVEMSVRWYDKEVQAADKAIAARAAFLGGASLKSVKPELLANGSPAMKAFDQAVSAARDTQDRITTRNAINAAHGKGPINEGPGTVMDTLRKSAITAGSTVIDQLQAMGASGKELQLVLEAINKQLKDIGANAPKTASPGWMGKVDDVTSAMRTGADAANLFGGPRGAQWANILNTGANAAQNTASAIAQGGANPIADAQAAISIASLGKQIFSLGSQSHDAARAIREASESIKSMIATLAASVNHDALGGELAAAQAADDARKSQINSSLSGKKREKERNQQLAADDALFARQKQQITQQYAIQQTFDKESLAARLDRAKGLSYQADLEDLAVKQQEEMNAAILAGRDAAYMASLAQVQLAEKTQLANNAITQLANSPTGFFAERYFGQFSTPSAFPGISPPTTTSGSSSGATVTGNTIQIMIPATSNPKQTAIEVVKALRQIGNEYGGMGTTIAQTMETIQ